MIITVNQKSNGPTLALLFTVVGSGEDVDEIGYYMYDIGVTKPITVNALAMARFKFQYVLTASGKSYTLMSSILLKKQENTKSTTVKVNVTYEKVEKECICTDDWAEYKLATKELDAFDGNNLPSFSLEAKIIVQGSGTVLMQSLKLYEDTEFTDFQLRAADGAVAVHKCVMAIHSDVFKKMMTGEWKETTEGCINLTGLTVRSLQQLKDYMYMGTLPDEDDELAMLLLVADCYMIENLKAECIRRLVETSAKIDKVIEFACQNNMPDLVRALLAVEMDRG